MPTQDEVGMWILDHCEDGDTYIVSHNGPMADYIARIDCDSETAEFILRACRSYHELVATCEAVVSALAPLVSAAEAMPSVGKRPEDMFLWSGVIGEPTDDLCATGIGGESMRVTGISFADCITAKDAVLAIRAAIENARKVRA